jgi:hypothetical protein
MSERPSWEHRNEISKLRRYGQEPSCKVDFTAKQIGMEPGEGILVNKSKSYLPDMVLWCVIEYSEGLGCGPLMMLFLMK